jgi:hypothetical protein
MTKRFTQQEAEGKVGMRIKSLVEFPSVPRGTTGRVAKADSAGEFKNQFGVIQEEFDVIIEWDLPTTVFGNASKPLWDWFTKSEYEQYLEEIEHDHA